MQKKITAASASAMEEHKKLMKSLGQQDTELESNWYKYTDTLLMVCSDQREDRTCRTDSRCPTGQGIGQGIGQSGHVLGHDAGQVI